MVMWDEPRVAVGVQIDGGLGLKLAARRSQVESLVFVAGQIGGEGGRAGAEHSAGAVGGSAGTIFARATAADALASADGDDAEEDVADEVVDPFAAGSA